MENYLYIIDKSKEFKGSCLNTMPEVPHCEISNTEVHYTHLTFDEYNKENGGHLVALTWDEFNDTYYRKYYEALQGEWIEISESKYWDLLECLPPMKWTHGSELDFFFISEAYTTDLHTCVITFNKKYYSALRSHFITGPEILTQIKSQLSK